MAEKNYSFGVEEEYFIVDGDTKALRKKAAPAFLADLKRKVGSVMNREMLQSQLEISTKPAHTMEQAHEDLKNLRQTIGAVAADHGLAYFAASTHPTAGWSGGQSTQKIRYDGMMQDLQMLGERNLLCGMHVHVQLPDVDRRVDVMRRMIPYIPLFIALSTSSPFWRSRSTGLMGYRLAAYDELPRTGIPELFESNEDYEAYINALIETRVIQDSSYIWWTIRPSAANPTLELRAPDVCTRVEDAVALAAL
jgi:carboxylate-amine ligase